MLSRSANCYNELPGYMVEGRKKKEAKATISMTLVVPSYMEDAAQKFMKERAKDYRDEFDEFIEKQIKKYRKKHNITDYD